MTREQEIAELARELLVASTAQIQEDGKLMCGSATAEDVLIQAEKFYSALDRRQIGAAREQVRGCPSPADAHFAAIGRSEPASEAGAKEWVTGESLYAESTRIQNAISGNPQTPWGRLPDDKAKAHNELASWINARIAEILTEAKRERDAEWDAAYTCFDPRVVGDPEVTPETLVARIEKRTRTRLPADFPKFTAEMPASPATEPTDDQIHSIMGRFERDAQYHVATACQDMRRLFARFPRPAARRVTFTRQDHVAMCAAMTPHQWDKDTHAISAEWITNCINARLSAPAAGKPWTISSLDTLVQSVPDPEPNEGVFPWIAAALNAAGILDTRPEAKP